MHCQSRMHTIANFFFLPSRVRQEQLTRVNAIVSFNAEMWETDVTRANTVKDDLEQLVSLT